MATLPPTPTRDAPRHPIRTAWARAVREPLAARPGAIAAGAALVAGAYVLMLLDRDTLYPLVNEEGWIETIGALGLAVASALFVAAALRRGRPRLVRAGLAVLALVFAFGAGEEVSWGERRLGVGAPDALIAANAQGESNLHNLTAIDGSVDNLFTAFVVVFAIALPLAVAMWPRCGAWARRLVPVIPAGIALLFLANELAFRAVWWVMPRGWYEGIHPFSQAAHEIREANASILFALAALALAMAGRRRTRGTVAAGE
jgi:uncharacterized protein (TIGR03382 family)